LIVALIGDLLVKRRGRRGLSLIIWLIELSNQIFVLTITSKPTRRKTKVIAVSRKLRLISQLSYNLPQLKLCLVTQVQESLRVHTIRTPYDAACLLDPLRHATEEHFVSLHLNAKHEVIGIHEVSHGTLSTSLVHPREVYKAALLANSFSILVCHNHPSGSALTPSEEDFSTTKQLLEAGQVLGVGLVDHLIIGPRQNRVGQKDAFFSFRESHPSLWAYN